MNDAPIVDTEKRPVNRFDLWNELTNYSYCVHSTVFGVCNFRTWSSAAYVYPGTCWGGILMGNVWFGCLDPRLRAQATVLKWQQNGEGSAPEQLEVLLFEAGKDEIFCGCSSTPTPPSPPPPPKKKKFRGNTTRPPLFVQSPVLVERLHRYKQLTRQLKDVSNVPIVSFFFCASWNRRKLSLRGKTGVGVFAYPVLGCQMGWLNRSWLPPGELQRMLPAKEDLINWSKV